MRAGRWQSSLCALVCALGATQLVSAQETNAPSAATALYVRSDSDRTTVITPRVRVGAPLAEETRVDLVYSVDVWSSASIDIRTSASPRITEQRDEIDVGIEHGIGDATLSGGYRYSTEPDYESHGGTLGASYDLADKSTTIGLGLRTFFDQVGRAGDPGFQEPTSTLSVTASLTQIVDTESLVQLIYELGSSQGYLSSPYRYVRFSEMPSQGLETCAPPVMACLLEKNPDSRLRHAVALRGRRSFGDHISLGAGYRFYLDDWEMTSHTASIDGAWSPAAAWLVSLGYRFYTQSAASHYQAAYTDKEIPEHYTSDKELSPLTSHRVSLEIGHQWEFDDLGSRLETTLLVAPSYYSYSDFPNLDHMQAIEATLALGVTL